ncbi:DUF2572 family protein [Pasteurellaceae bacterium HPA106]|uniref:DUF2572 family protein n=1 Tax=Spirabiliibacterium pneumoniae TaxID=221400 RepID=UPI001AACA52C|nr:DUF2572 family protein [Spirabiliibacterium pneumoniae]MBE2896300.1 DUF2572 family protein [Spirabiliibacterium pneumoniae]
MKARKGAVALSIIAVMGALLSAVFLFQALQLSQQRAQLAQQQGYFALDYQLHARGKWQSQHCGEARHAHKPHFVLSHQAQNTYASISHRQVCRFLPYVAPEELHSAHLTTLERLIPERDWAVLAAQFWGRAPVSQPAIWWLKAGQHWQLDETVSGVVFAQKNSVIEGRGQVHGVVISQGHITLAVEVMFDRDIALESLHRHGFWQIEPRSWHDFNAL